MGYKQFFGTADYDTAKHVSDFLGQHTIEYQTHGTSNQQQMAKLVGASSDSINANKTGHHLWTPDEIMRDKDLNLVLVFGEPPYPLGKINYLESEYLYPHCDTNPYYQQQAGPPA